MYKCNNCNRLIPDNQAETSVVKVGSKENPKLYCKECGEPVIYISDVPRTDDIMTGSKATLISNSDNSINTNSHNITNNTTHNSTTTNNTTNNSSTTIIYNDETVSTKLGVYKRNEVFRCKTCKEDVPKIYMHANSGVCQDCWIKIQKNDGDSAFGEGLYEEAIKYYEQGLNATLDNDDLRQDLCFKLGRCYFELKNGNKAKSYFAKSKGKHFDSIYYLGRCMELGMGGPKDIEEAKIYYHEAAKKGSELARIALSSLITTPKVDKSATPQPVKVSPKTSAPDQERYVVRQVSSASQTNSNRNYLIVAVVVVVSIVCFITLGNNNFKEERTDALVEQISVEETTKQEAEVPSQQGTNLKENNVQSTKVVVSETKKEDKTNHSFSSTSNSTQPSSRQGFSLQKVSEQDALPAKMSDADLVSQGKNAMRSMEYDKAKASLRQAANHENTEAFYQLGMLYSNSNFDEYNRDVATNYFVKAAKKNHIDAMYQAGMLLLGVDNSSAKQWLEKAANNGHSRAMSQLSKIK